VVLKSIASTAKKLLIFETSYFFNEFLKIFSKSTSEQMGADFAITRSVRLWANLTKENHILPQPLPSALALGYCDQESLPYYINHFQ
jgi:hypothetical protein